MPLPTGEIPDSLAAAVPEKLSMPPALAAVIAESAALPPYSLMIGASDDHAHLFLDLSDARPGSILIAGDPDSGKRRLLTSILTSAALLNPPRRVRFGILSTDIHAFKPLAARPHCYKVISTRGGDAAEMVLELADLAEQRLKNRPSAGAFLFAVDGLADFVEAQDEDIVEQLRWLAQNGPQVQVWMVATLDAAAARKVPASLLEAFGSHLVGPILSEEVASAVIDTEKAHMAGLVPGQQFGTLFGDDWVPFWIPAVEG